MIIHATTGTGFGGTLSYIHKENAKLSQEQKPEVLELNHVYGTPKQQAKQMRFVAMENSHSSRPVLHVSVSFSPAERLAPEKVEDVLKQVVKEFGATRDNNQYAMVRHNDAGHEHYHIVMNKVGFDGKNIDTSYIQNKAHIVADMIEQQQGLMPTEGRKIFYDPSNDKGFRYATKEELAKYKPLKKVFKDKRPNVKKAKEEIQTKLIDVLQSAKTPEELKEKLADRGVEVRYSEDRENNNAIRGASFRTDKISVKGGDIGFKWAEITKILEANLALVQSRGTSKKESVRSPVKLLLSEEITSKMKAYIRENPDKFSQAVNLFDNAVRIFMKELNPDQNSWNTWQEHSDYEKKQNELNNYAENILNGQKEDLKTNENVSVPSTEKPVKNELTKPVPTLKEEIQIEFVKQFHEALDKVTTYIIHMVKIGEPNCVRQALQNFGFKEQGQDFVFSTLGSKVTVQRKPFDDLQAKILEKVDAYESDLKKYNDLMEKKPVEIFSTDWLIGEKKEKESRNNSLAEQQIFAVKPVFKMAIYPPLGNFRLQTDFDKRMDEFKSALEKGKVAEPENLVKKELEQEIRSEKRSFGPRR